MKKSDTKNQATNKTDDKLPTITEKRLDFLLTIFKSMHLSQKDAAELSGTSQQLLSWWKKKDDARLVSIYNMFNNMGITLSFELEPLETEPIQIKESSYNITISEGLTPQKSNKTSGNILDNIIDSDNMLRPIAIEIKKHYTDLAAFSKAKNLRYYTIHSWFYKDSIKISELLNLTQILKTKIRWNLSKKC